jgi:ferritin-like metal-binding protein YciE
MAVDAAQLKSNFEEQIATTEKQIRELEENLAKAKEYKIKLQGGLETIGLLSGEEETPAAAPPAEAPAE